MSSAPVMPPGPSRILGNALAAVRGRLPWSLLGPVLVSVLGCLVALAVAPRTVDLSAHVYRSILFDREGFTLWNANWYGGHHTPAYSLIFPPLGALLGPLGVGAVAAVTASACFAVLARGRWGEKAAFWGGLLFSVGTATVLFTGRIPFGLGVTFGLAALLAEQRGRRWPAIVLAACCPLASPVAGVFLGMAAAALLLTGDRRGGLMLGIACAIPLFGVTLAFPEGAHEPFDFSTFLPLPLLMAAFIALIPKEDRALRAGAAIYAASSVVFFALPTPMGGNSVRLGALFGGPVLVAALAGRWPAGRRRRWAIGLLLAGFTFWQWSPAVRETTRALADPATRTSYYQPLIAELDRRAAAGDPIGRIEIPLTRSHWEAAEVARHYPIARGWERQLDIQRNRLFYGGALGGATYAAWLSDNAIGYVAVADAKPDYSAYGERDLIRRGLPYLRQVWRSKHWRLFAVTRPHSLVVPAGSASIGLASMGTDSFTLDVGRPGSAVVKVQWSQYWKPHGGCVERDGEWTRVTASRPGRLRVAIGFSLERVFSHGRRCA